MIITSHWREILEACYENEAENSLKIDRRIISWILSSKKNIHFKTAKKITEILNEYFSASDNIEDIFVIENLLSSEKERGLILEFQDKEANNSFWTEIIHYVLTGKFNGFAPLDILYFLLFLSIFIIILSLFI